MCVVANIYEPVRYPVLEIAFMYQMRKVIYEYERKFVNFTPYARYLTMFWSRSRTVIIVIETFYIEIGVEDNI